MLSKFKQIVNNYRTVVKFCKENSNKIKSIEEELSNVKGIINNENEVLNSKIDKIASINNDIFNNFRYSNLEFLTLDNTVKKCKVLIVGFYGAPNLGDELMLQTLLLKLSNFNSNIDVTIMLCENSKFDITTYPGVKILHYPKSVLDLNVISNYFDCVIFGGGALLDDSDFNIYNSQLSLGNILINLSLRMIAFNKKLILYGLSCSDSIINPEYILKLDFIIQNCTYISLRDENSKKTLERIGIETNKISIVNDIVFSNQSLYHTKKLSSSVSEQCNIGIVYICSNIDEMVIFTNKIITSFKNKYKKVHISLIPFYQYNNNDKDFYKKLSDKLNYDNISIEKYPRNLDELISIFNNCEYVISMRYHATLVANSLGKKVLNLKYDTHNHYNNKIDYLYKKYKFKNYEILYSKLNEPISHNVIDKFVNGKSNETISDKIYNESNKEIKHVIKLLTKENNNEN